MTERYHTKECRSQEIKLFPTSPHGPTRLIWLKVFSLINFKLQLETDITVDSVFIKNDYKGIK